jgi:hypothetical protein
VFGDKPVVVVALPLPSCAYVKPTAPIPQVPSVCKYVIPDPVSLTMKVVLVEWLPFKVVLSMVIESVVEVVEVTVEGVLGVAASV